MARPGALIRAHLELFELEAELGVLCKTQEAKIPAKLKNVGGEKLPCPQLKISNVEN